jgi:hypothetical protein
MGDVMLINGRELTVKEYNGQRVLTLWDIARLHGVTPKTIRENFERNKKYLKEDKHYNLIKKSDEFAYVLSASKEIDYHAFNAVKDIPVFTGPGYLMMVKPLTGALAWKVQEELIDTYFQMQEVKEVIKNQLNPESAIEHSKFLISLIDAAGMGPEVKLLTAKSIYRMAGVELPFEITLEQKLYDLETIAKKMGILSENGKPHANAVSAIIKQIDIPVTIKLDVLETNGKWTGSVTKYKEEIFDYIAKWLEESGRPPVVESKNRKYKVVYGKAM